MVSIDLGIGKSISKKKKTNSSSISFEQFNNENVERKGKVKSISLRLKDVEPFDKNVRLRYNDEDMENLKQSIKNRDDIGNIDVYHIKKGDRYIISDGHRTLKAFHELYGDDHKVEVVVRGEAPDLTPDIELKLMEIGFITSNTKKNLGFYEEAQSIKKYLDQKDKIEPDKAPHKISQKNVYEALGLSKAKAMKYNKLLQKFSLEQLSEFEDDEVSYNLLLKLSEIKTQEEFDEAVEVVKTGEVETPTDLNTFNEIKEDIVSDTENEGLGKEDIHEKTVEEMQKVKLREEYKSVKSIKSASKKICKELLKLNLDSLTEEEKEILQESINNVKDIIKDKQL